MKNKSLLAILICTCVVTSLSIMPTSVNAATNGNAIKAQQQGVYSQAYTDAEWSKAKLKPVMLDKGAAKTSIQGIASSMPIGSYPTRNGVILVTSDPYKDLIPTGHAAIIYTSTLVIESVSNGVINGPNNWNITKGTCYGVTVDGTTLAQDNEASNWCASKRGLPYNKNYLNPYTRSSFYCSQLVYAAFLDKYGIDLNTISYLQAVHPMELVNTPKTRTIYQK
jgi:uncharacterized protein YycO